VVRNVEQFVALLAAVLIASAVLGIGVSLTRLGVHHRIERPLPPASVEARADAVFLSCSGTARRFSFSAVPQAAISAGSSVSAPDKAVVSIAVDIADGTLTIDTHTLPIIFSDLGNLIIAANVDNHVQLDRVSGVVDATIRMTPYSSMIFNGVCKPARKLF